MIRYRLRAIGKNSQFSLYARGKYKLNYRRGEITTALKKTLGIFCFKRKKDAEYLKRISRMKMEIYRVETAGKGKVPDKICAFVDPERMDNFYYIQPKDISQILIIPGIICYNQVKVLD